MRRWAAVLSVLFALAAGCTDHDRTAPPGPPVPANDAYLTTGPAGDGRYVLPNGRFITPIGERATVRRFPMSMALQPDGERLFVATAKTPSLAVINPASMTVEHEVELHRHFHGMAINATGTRLYVAGGARDRVYEYDLAGDLPVLARELRAFGYPMGLALSADETLLYVPLGYGKRVAVIDLATGSEVASMNTGYYPYAVAVSEPLGRAIVTAWGTSIVSVFDSRTGELLADIPVGKAPEGVVLDHDGRSALVACADADEVHRVDLVDLAVTQVIPLREEDEGFGVMPTALAFGPDGRLYVVATGMNSVDVVDPEAGRVVGRIPTEWYPTAVLPTRETLYVLAGKGVGSGPGEVDDEAPDLDPEGGRLLGAVQAIPAPDEETLAEYTRTVEANNTRTARFYDEGPYDSPIPSRAGAPSSKIKHVVYILKENKTFDQVFSDLPGVMADPSLLIFGEPYTPNFHALAREFTVLDNYYSESHESDMGHSWATQAVANDYVEKAWVASHWTTLTGVEPASIPESGTVFRRMLESGVSFRVYGEVVGTLPDIELLAPYIDFNYGFYNMAVSDRIKAGEVIREWEAGIFPSYIYILLPNDHTYGTDPGAPTMDYLVADNDAAVGMLVDWIIRSPYWPETVVFITEDDPQSGVDHIDAHRTPFVVVSPYARRGHVSSVHYSMASLWLTIERLLGLAPLTDYDRHTAPMYDLFQPEPILETAFRAIPSSVPFATNPDDAPMADYSRRQNWSVPDQVERIGEVVWAYMRPGEPYPEHLAVAPSEREEEAEEWKEGDYGALVRAHIEYAQTHGLLREEHLIGKTAYLP